MQAEIKNLNSAISSLNSIIETKTNELSNYKNQANHSQKAAFFKQAEINNLTAILNAFIETLNEIENEFKTLQKQLNEQKEKVVKYEAFCLLHGISLSIVKKVIAQPLKQLIAELKTLQKGKPQPEVKTTSKPLINFNTLKQLAKKQSIQDAIFTREIINNL